MFRVPRLGLRAMAGRNTTQQGDYPILNLERTIFLTRSTGLDVRDGAWYTGFRTLEAPQGKVLERTEVSQLQQALDAVESLPPGDQETLIELIRHRLEEKCRAEIARNAKETLQAVRDGCGQYGSVEDLRRDLLGEP